MATTKNINSVGSEQTETLGKEFEYRHYLKPEEQHLNRKAKISEQFSPKMKSVYLR